MMELGPRRSGRNGNKNIDSPSPGEEKGHFQG